MSKAKCVAEITIVSLLILSGSYGCASQGERLAEGKGIVVTAKLMKNVEKEVVLHVTVKNASANAIKVRQSDLPWEGRYSMIMTAVRLTATAEPLESKYTFSDPMPRQVIISPGETISGDVSLEDRFVAFRPAVKQGLLLFWSYQLETADRFRYPRSGGWLEISESSTN